MARTTSGKQAVSHHPAVIAALEQMARDQAVERVWSQDHTLWKPHPTEIQNRLGWLTVGDRMHDEAAALRTFAVSVRDSGIRDVVLLGMGGSSLGPEVLRSTFKSQNGFPRLWVLDSTVPGWVRRVTDAINPIRTLFILASKSGGTIEVMSLFAHFWGVVSKAKGNRGGTQFIAITDPGTSLEKLAAEQGFWRTFSNPPDIGGRYSVLSYFGLVPAALAGIDVGQLLNRAAAMAHVCRQPAPLEENPGAYLGAAMAGYANSGRDKVTLLTSPALSSFGLWVEQLLAESTGKEGKGLIPIAGEPAVKPDAYGSDRFFAYLRLKGDATTQMDAHVAALERGGQPVVTLNLRDRFDLGAEFFRWEFATAIAGYLLHINPFDQPNVQESKDNTARVLRQVERDGKLPAEEGLSPQEGISRLTDRATPGRYLAVLAYMTPSKEHERAMAALRKSFLTRYHVASTMGYGPRYLHSTGQLHKGGPETGLFLQLVESMKPDVSIPDKPYTFGTLAQAQALGDLQSLQAHGRLAVRIDLGRRPATTLGKLNALLSPARRKQAARSKSRKSSRGSARRRPAR
jgi:glucose-6-phosphate isomerase/transaldolase/glucose-6-phosphate isomerase